MAQDSSGILAEVIAHWAQRLITEGIKVTVYNGGIAQAVVAEPEAKPKPKLHRSGEDRIAQRQQAIEIMLARLATAEEGLIKQNLVYAVRDAGLKIEAHAILNSEYSALTLALKSHVILRGPAPKINRYGRQSWIYYDRQNYIKKFASLPEEAQKELVEAAVNGRK